MATITVHKRTDPHSWFSHDVDAALFERLNVGGLDIALSKRDYVKNYEGVVRPSHSLNGGLFAYAMIGDHAFLAFTLPLGETVHSFMSSRFNDFDVKRESLFDRIEHAVKQGGSFRLRMDDYLAKAELAMAEEHEIGHEEYPGPALGH